VSPYTAAARDYDRGVAARSKKDEVKTNGLTGLTAVAFGLLVAAWLSVASVGMRTASPPPASNVHAEHVSMVEQMRQDVTSQMVQQMDELEWRQMRESGMVAQMERRQQASDRMLARKP